MLITHAHTYVVNNDLYHTYGKGHHSAVCAQPTVAGTMIAGLPFQYDYCNGVVLYQAHISVEREQKVRHKSGLSNARPWSDIKLSKL